MGNRKLIVYHKKMLRTFDQAVTTVEVGTGKRSSKTTSELKPITELRQLCIVLFRMCIRRGSKPLRLEQLRNALQEEHGLAINEMTFQCVKLSEVLKLEPLATAFKLETEVGAMKISIGDVARYSDDVKDMHRQAEQAERTRDMSPRAARSRSRSHSL